MNKRNILKVAKAIENHEIKWLGFNMGGWVSRTRKDYLDGCGTTACIAGWTCLVLDPPETPIKTAADELKFYARFGWSKGFVDDFAAHFLGLDPDAANALFFRGEDGWTLSRKTKQTTAVQAVAVLRHLAKTGKVDWSVGAP